MQGWSNEDTHATRVWLFHKCLVSHLVEGFVRDVPNNKSNPNNKHTQANVLSMCAGETRLFTWSPVHAFHLRTGKQARKQAWPVSPRKERARWMAALVALCQSLLAAVALVSPKGPRQPGELSERRSWWWSESPGRITLDRAIWKCDSLSSTCWTGAWPWLGALGLLLSKQREHSCFQMEAFSPYGCSLFTLTLLCRGRVN